MCTLVSHGYFVSRNFGVDLEGIGSIMGGLWEGELGWIWREFWACGKRSGVKLNEEVGVGEGLKKDCAFSSSPFCWYMVHG